MTQVATINFDRSTRFATTRRRSASAPPCAPRDRAVLLCHHYQRADVYQHADLTGDSLKLSKLASQTEAEFFVFCGVHFMAEVADIMSKPHQKAILPDLAAGCSMADMASLAKVERCWRELDEVLGTPDSLITPVTTSTRGGPEAFCGEHGGIVCPRRMRRRSSIGHSLSARRCCSSPISTSVAGRLQERHSPRADGRVGPRPRARRPHAGRNPQREDPAVEGALLGHQMFQKAISGAGGCQHPTVS